MNLSQLSASLESVEAKNLLKEMYGEGREDLNGQRYLEVAQGFVKTFGTTEFELFSSPGRTEICGNHTDHNHGKVIAGTIHMDCVAAASANGSDKVHIISASYGQDMTIDLNDLEPIAPYVGTYNLTKGVLKGMMDRGYKVSGFDCYTTSNVPGGAGVSSSASYEMLLCSIVDYLFNDYSQDIIAYGKSGQYGENVYWQKGSGLLDQVGCAAGGIVSIDFADITSPKLKRIDCDFNEFGLDLVLVNTGGSHANLSEEYSAMPNEMKQIAAYFGKEVLSEITEEMVIDECATLRKEFGDRSVLRALHFFSENRRVEQMITALEAKDKDEFLSIVRASGKSSFERLQNCYVSTTPQSQNISVSLALAEEYLRDIPESACRVHGGGFAGVIAVFLPQQETEGFCAYMNKVLEADASYVMHIRPQGALRVNL